MYSAPHRYLFHHASWHWGREGTLGSEHHLESRQYPAEIQLYHYNSERYSSYEEAVGEEEGIAALSFLYEVSNEDNSNLNKVMQAISVLSFRIENIGQNDEFSEGEFESEVPNFQLDKLLPSEGVNFMDSYFYYSGSLTSPVYSKESTGPPRNCNESVLWINYEKTIPISESQLGTLRSLLTAINKKQQLQYPSRKTCFGNFRPIHSLNMEPTSGGQTRRLTGHNLWTDLS